MVYIFVERPKNAKKPDVLTFGFEFDLGVIW
jgi:hypothetical protein